MNADDLRRAEELCERLAREARTLGQQTDARYLDLVRAEAQRDRLRKEIEAEQRGTQGEGI